MSELFRSGLIGISDRDKNSLDHILIRYMNLGFLEGLDSGVAVKVAVGFEIAALILLSEEKMCDMQYKMTGEITHEDNEFGIVIFPIIRRIISGFEDAHEHVPEIFGMIKKEFNSVLWMSIKEKKESAIVYFYDTVLPESGDEWHMNRPHKTYRELKNSHFKKFGYFLKKDYEDYIPIDLQAEFCAYVAKKIENKLRKKYEKLL